MEIIPGLIQIVRRGQHAPRILAGRSVKLKLAVSLSWCLHDLQKEERLGMRNTFPESEGRAED